MKSKATSDQASERQASGQRGLARASGTGDAPEKGNHTLPSQRPLTFVTRPLSATRRRLGRRTAARCPKRRSGRVGAMASREDERGRARKASRTNRLASRCRMSPCLSLAASASVSCSRSAEAIRMRSAQRAAMAKCTPGAQGASEERGEMKQRWSFGSLGRAKDVEKRAARVRRTGSLAPRFPLCVATAQLPTPTRGEGDVPN
jgi:hypothetical protein